MDCKISERLILQECCQGTFTRIGIEAILVYHLQILKYIVIVGNIYCV